MKTNVHFLSPLTQFFLEWEMFQTNILETIKTQIEFSIFFPKIVSWKCIVERGTPQTTIWLMYISCWITKATDTHSELVIFTAFLRQKWLYCTKAPQCYVIRSLPLFYISPIYFRPHSLCHGSGGQYPPCHYGGLVSIPDQSLWYFWCRIQHYALF